MLKKIKSYLLFLVNDMFLCSLSSVLISFVFYTTTIAPTIVGGDSSEYCLLVQKSILKFGNPHDHPLYILIGKIFYLLPFEPAYNLNLMSAFFGSFTILFVFLATYHITESKYASFFGSLSLMVSHAFWGMTSRSA